jgi:SAM-dependent methyltransferase
MDQTRLTEIVKAVKEVLSKKGASSESERESLRECMRTGQVIDFDRSALTFAHTYWERNFWKAAYFFSREYVNPSLLAKHVSHLEVPLQFVVLGAGSAADTVACLAWLDQAKPLQKVVVTLIEKSRAQLSLAREIVQAATRCLSQISCEVRYVHARLSEWQPATNSVDLILLSHVLTEVPQEAEALVQKTVSALRPRGDVLLIERERDPIWQRTRAQLALNGITTHDVGLSADKFPEFAQNLLPSEMDMTPSYVRGSVPENKRLLELVRGYFQAWIHQTSDTIPEIFTPHALYDEKPGIEPVLRGVDRIRTYWDKHPGQQRNIHLTVQNIAYSDTVGVCSFTGDFDTPKQHIAIVGAINFFLDPYLGKIHRVVEHFGTVKTPFKNVSP